MEKHTVIGLTPCGIYISPRFILAGPVLLFLPSTFFVVQANSNNVENVEDAASLCKNSNNM